MYRKEEISCALMLSCTQIYEVKSLCQQHCAGFQTKEICLTGAWAVSGSNVKTSFFIRSNPFDLALVPKEKQTFVFSWFFCFCRRSRILFNKERFLKRGRMMIHFSFHFSPLHSKVRSNYYKSHNAIMTNNKFFFFSPPFFLFSFPSPFLPLPFPLFPGRKLAGEGLQASLQINSPLDKAAKVGVLGENHPLPPII